MIHYLPEAAQLNAAPGLKLKRQRFRSITEDVAQFLSALRSNFSSVGLGDLKILTASLIPQASERRQFSPRLKFK